MNARGNTLVEILVSVMIAAVVTMAVFSVALVGRQNKGRVARRAAAALAARQVLEELRNYVTADQTAVKGPGENPNGWGLRGDRCGCWALQAGEHSLIAPMWLPTLSSEPFNGEISYMVTDQATAQGALPTVTMNIRWSEP